jgi:hypothetical protein
MGTRYPSELEIRDPDGAPRASDGDLGRRRFTQVLDFLTLQRAAIP